MNLGREHWTRLASGLKRTAPSLIDVSSEEFVELKPSITTLLDFFHIIDSFPYARFPSPVIYVHMTRAMATMGWVSLSDKHLVAFILHQHTLTPTTWEFISMYRRIWLSYHKYANHDAYQRHRRYEEIPSTWNRSRICHNFISFRQIFSHKRYFSAWCGIGIVVITISYCDTQIYQCCPWKRCTRVAM